MGDCLKLLTWASDDPPEAPEDQGDAPALRQTGLHEEVLHQLKVQFTDCPKLLPVAVIGEPKCGKSAILDRLVGPQGPVFSNIQEDSGILVYVKPVPTENTQLLLMEMTLKFSDDDDDYQKMLHVLLSVSSVCIICLKADYLFFNLKKILGIYNNLRTSCHLEVSKFLICVDHADSLERKPLGKGYAEFQANIFKDICEFIPRGKNGLNEECRASLIRKLSDEQLCSRYELSHKKSAAPEELPSIITTITRILTVLHRFAEAKSSFQEYVDAVPNLERPDWPRLLEAAEPVRVVERHETKAIPLLSWSVQIEKDMKTIAKIESCELMMIDMLREQFSLCTRVIPILVIGNSQFGKSGILDKFASLDGADRPFASIAENPGLLVYPRPVQLGDSQLLLMEATVDLLIGIEEQDESKKKLQEAQHLLMQKIVHLLLSLTSVCICCYDKSATKKNMEQILQIYMQMEAKCHLKVSRFLVCVENEKTAQRFHISEAFPQALARKCELFYRGVNEISGELFNQIKNKIYELQVDNEFEATHQLAKESVKEPTMIRTLIVILDTLKRLTSLNRSWVHHITEAPAFNDANCLLALIEIENRQKENERLSQVQPCLFFKKVDGLVELDIEVQKKLMSFNQDKVVIVAVMGPPGLGKSTFLNCLYQILTQSDEYRDVFKTGNTQFHTTFDSHVFPAPLNIPAPGGKWNQLMLVDLEGLGGIETTEVRAQMLQNSLVTSILTVSSVYCILVRNEAPDLAHVEEIVQQIWKLKAYFSFQVARIFLLFQDKYINAGENDNLKKSVAALNKQFFNNQRVIVTLNKPNLHIYSAARDKSLKDFVQAEKFLGEFVQDLNYPKLNERGNPVKLPELLAYLSYIAPSNVDPASLKLNANEQAISNAIFETQQQKLKTAFDQSQCENLTETLTVVFNVQVQKIIADYMNYLLANHDCTKNVIDFVSARLKIKENSYRQQLIEIELFFNALCDSTIEKLKGELETALNFAYYDNTWIGNFTIVQKQLTDKLDLVAAKYDPTIFPELSLKVTTLRTDIDEKASSLRNYYYWKYGTWVATAATSAVSGAAYASTRFASWIATEVVAAEVGTVVNAAKWVAAGAGLMSAPTPLYTGIKWATAPEKAFKLYPEKWFSSNIKVDSGFIKMIESWTDNPLVSIFLMIARKDTESATFLNDFMKYTYPIALQNHKIFNSSTWIQATHFVISPKPERGSENQQRDKSRCGVLIYVGFETPSNAPQDALLARLLQKAALTVISLSSVEETTTSLGSLLRVYRPTMKVRWEIVPSRIRNEAISKLQGWFPDNCILSLDRQAVKICNSAQDAYPLLVAELLKGVRVTPDELKTTINNGAFCANEARK